jgi:hypothetical protein
VTVAYYSGTVYVAWRGGFAYRSSSDNAFKVAREHAGLGVHITTKAQRAWPRAPRPAPAG